MANPKPYKGKCVIFCEGNYIAGGSHEKLTEDISEARVFRSPQAAAHAADSYPWKKEYIILPVQLVQIGKPLTKKTKHWYK